MTEHGSSLPQIPHDVGSTTISAADVREQLFNAGETGMITAIQVSRDRITQIRGIMFDLDPEYLHAGPGCPTIPADPGDFYTCVVRPWLDRNPVLAKAEVRISGRGLHVILRFDQPVVFNSDHDRDRWAGIIKAILCLLPRDTQQPTITAVTRAIGSINSKNQVKVSQLTPGEPVTEAEVLELYRQLEDAPFQTICSILYGGGSISPCPVCQQPDSSLTVLRHHGECYGGCGKVRLIQLYEVLYKPQVPTVKGSKICLAVNK